MGDPLGPGVLALQETPPSRYPDSLLSLGSCPGCFSHPSHLNPFGASAVAQLEDHDTRVNMGALTPNSPLAFSSRAKSQWRWQKAIFSCEHNNSSVLRCSGFWMDTITCIPSCLGSQCHGIPPQPGVPKDTLPWGAWEEGGKFPGAGDPVGLGGAFQRLHVLLFPVEMPMNKGCLADDSCTLNSCWLSWG